MSAPIISGGRSVCKQRFRRVLAGLDHDELRDTVAEAWLTRAQKRVAKAWLAEHGLDD